MYKLSLYLFFAALLAGCGMSDSADPNVISTIQADMQISLANPFDAPSHFAFVMSTLDEKCENAQILADGAIQGQNVHVAVSGLLIEPTCTGNFQQVQKDIHMDLSPGEYDFSLSIGEDLFNKGVLSYDGDIYTLEMYSTFGIKIGHSTLNRIPEGVIWGSISGDRSASELGQEFLSALSPVTSDVELNEGYYGHFTIQNSDIQNLTLTDDVLHDFTQLFVYQLDSDIDGLQFVIDNFRAQYGDAVNITCTSWSGVKF